MNLLQKMTHEARCDVLCFMHNDGEAEPGMDLRFRERIEAEWRSNPKFGVLFTHYDTLSAINMTAVRQIGPWDNLFSGYFADREYYARLRQHGFEEIQTDIGVVHHGSMTIKILGSIMPTRSSFLHTSVFSGNFADKFETVFGGTLR
jgi:hypothetical protein